MAPRLTRPSIQYAIVFGLFALAFYFHTLTQLDFFRLIPGDTVDARLNNYFLENIYQYLVRGTGSITHLSFFYPYPFVGGFSDNLFGSAPVYLVARWLTGEPDTAFQIWYVLGYPANFFAAYYAFRKLGVPYLAAATGALIFAFALPVTAHAAHAQLQYRFGIPLAAAAHILFLRRAEWRYLIIALGWLIWQFFCGIYEGFFFGAFTRRDHGGTNHQLDVF